MSNSTTAYLSELTATDAMYALPTRLWQLYTEHLCNYHPASWVGKAAYTSRVLAFALVLPFVILTGLDVASYIIARTLGVIDDVRASTTDKAAPPIIKILDASPQIPKHVPADSISGYTHTPSPGMLDDDVPSHSNLNAASGTIHLGSELPSLDVSDPHAYFASEENSLKLSGVGVFSPAASRPPSPTLTRRHLIPESRMPPFAMSSIKTTGDAGKHTNGESEEGLTFRPRTRRVEDDETTESIRHSSLLHTS